MQEVRSIWARRAATHEGKAAASQSEEEEQWLEGGNKQLTGACAEVDAGRASSSGLGSDCPPSMSRGGAGDVRVAYMHMHGQCSLLKERRNAVGMLSSDNVIMIM